MANFERPQPPVQLAASSDQQTDPKALAVEHLCHHYMRHHGIHPDLDTLMWHDWLSRESFTHREVAERVWRENSSIALPLIQVTLQEMIRRLRIAKLGALRRALVNDDVPEGAKAELVAFVRLIAREGTPDDRLDYYVAAFAQLIWQVKRKLRGLPSHWDVMPVLVGPQAAGKSTAVARFAQPLNILYLADADFDIFVDPFRITALSRYYLVCLDEMGKSKAADLEKVKQRITASTVQARAMRSEQERRLTRNASFIGTSNHSLSDTVADHTGMRRFAEILCREDAWSREWGDQLNSLDYDLIWACETGLDDNAPLFAQRELALRFQAETAMPSAFELFREYHLSPAGEEVMTSLKDIYAAYVSFESLQARRPITIQRFAKQMEAVYGAGIKPGNARHWRGVQLVTV